jgi:hypothetical protein
MLARSDRADQKNTPQERLEAAMCQFMKALIGALRRVRGAAAQEAPPAVDDTPASILKSPFVPTGETVLATVLGMVPASQPFQQT